MVETEVALALIGIVGSMVGAGVWVIKYFADKLINDIREHTEASIELRTYLVDRNGRDAEQHKATMGAMTQLTKAVSEHRNVVER